MNWKKYWKQRLIRFINIKNISFFMDIEYIKQNYKFETLTEKHDLSGFECDSDDLNDFLKNDALQQQENKLNLTKLIICDGEIVGYVSLLTDTIPLKDIRDDILKEDIKSQLNSLLKRRGCLLLK